MLTEKQFELLKYIHQRVTESGISPSYDEMKVAVNLHSKSGIHRLINALEERGYIRRLPNRARALEILKHPFDNIESNINFKLRLSDETFWEDVFNKLEYKSVLCSNSFIQYQYIYNLSFEKKIFVM